jgi:hypothetical protein
VPKSLKKPPLWLGKVSVRRKQNTILTPEPLQLDWCDTTGTYWNKKSDSHTEGYLKPGLSMGASANYNSFVSASKQEVTSWLKEFKVKQLLES